MKLRAPEDVLRFDVMGAAHPHRLSFLRVLMRRIERESWRFARRVWRIDEQGYGTAVYEVQTPKRVYSFVAFSTYLDPAQRTDRVIATQWDASFALYDGIPGEDDIARLAANVPKQEAGRLKASELVLARANRSLRLWDHVIERLKAGGQPEAARIAEVGYLMRTTAVYGSGKFGLADYEAIQERDEFAAPYQAEMLTVYLAREFTIDLVEHIAGAAIAPRLRAGIGVGNSTGLGMAPYLVNHPAVLNQWLLVRETALARVRAIEWASAGPTAEFLQLVKDYRKALPAWLTSDERQQARLAELTARLERLEQHVSQGALERQYCWDALYLWAEAQDSLELRELLVSLMIEPHGGLVDDLEGLYRVDEHAHRRIDGAMDLARLKSVIDKGFAWAREFDFASPAANARFWYASQEKLEPRLGERFEEQGGELEHPLGVARDVELLRLALVGQGGSVARFLSAHPEHRHTVRRVQLAASHPYGELHGNVLDAKMMPIDLLRFKLAFFGATRFDPRSDRWVRITLCQGLPALSA